MSTLTQSGNSKIIQSRKDLEGYFLSHAKTPDHLRLGMEAEFLGVFKESGKALPYSGPSGIEEIFKFLIQSSGYTPVMDQNHIIALKKGSVIIALEPGGQVELSAPPVSNVFEIESQIQDFIRELKKAEIHFSNIRFLAVGIQPFSTLDEISWIPKRRYALMAEAMAQKGSLSHHMMKRTATNQLNLDYTGEEDAMHKMRTAMSITSIVTALFSNSSFSEGRPNGCASYRLEIWNHTDPDRSGFLPFFTEPGRRFSDYLDYILKIPVFFIIREGQWLALNGLRFEDFIQHGFHGHRPTLDDFELHLSTAFPEVRIKQYLEVRGADCQSVPLIPAVAAFWKGILYDAKAREEALNLVSFASPEELVKLHWDVSKLGLNAKLAGQPIRPLADELVTIACRGLTKQQTPSHQNECLFLDRIREVILKPGKSPGETLVEKWQSEFIGRPMNLLEYLGI